MRSRERRFVATSASGRPGDEPQTALVRTSASIAVNGKAELDQARPERRPRRRHAGVDERKPVALPQEVPVDVGVLAAVDARNHIW